MKLFAAVCFLVILKNTVKSKNVIDLTQSNEALKNLNDIYQQAGSDIERNQSQINDELRKIRNNINVKDEQLRLNLLQFAEFVNKILSDSKNLAKRFGVSTDGCVNEIKKTTDAVQNEELQKNTDFFQKITNEVSKYGNDLVDIKVLQTTVVLQLNNDINGCQQNKSCTPADAKKIEENIGKSISDLKTHLGGLKDINEKVLGLYGIVENFAQKSKEILDQKKLNLAYNSISCINKRIEESEVALRKNLKELDSNLQKAEKNLQNETQAKLEAIQLLSQLKLATELDLKRHEEEIQSLNQNCTLQKTELSNSCKNQTYISQVGKCEEEKSDLIKKHKAELTGLQNLNQECTKKLDLESSKYSGEITRLQKENSELTESKSALEKSLSALAAANNATILKYQEELSQITFTCTKEKGALQEELKNLTAIRLLDQENFNEVVSSLELKHKHELEFVKKQYQWEYDEQTKLLNAKHVNSTRLLEAQVNKLNATNEVLKASLGRQGKALQDLGSKLSEAVNSKLELQKNLTAEISNLKTNIELAQKQLTEAEEKLKSASIESANFKKSWEDEKTDLVKKHGELVKSLTQERDQCLKDYDIFKSIIAQALKPEEQNKENNFKNKLELANIEAIKSILEAKKEI